MIKKMITILICSPMLAIAAVPTWKIDPNHSSLTFTATQNNAPVTGSFKTFSGDIHFDPAQLAASNVMIKINTGSVSSSYDQVASALVTTDWFNPALFPQAIFKANHFIKNSDNHYTAKGSLTLRGKTVPVTVFFTLPEYTDKKAIAKGSATLERTQFGVGQGDWAATDTIKDTVNIEFTITAMQK
jgi:polyisoprenoid-binding protein YceI